MSQVFEGYERQYCELSANLSRLCTAAGALDGGKFLSKNGGKKRLTCCSWWMSIAYCLMFAYT